MLMLDHSLQLVHFLYKQWVCQQSKAKMSVKKEVKMSVQAGL